MIYFIQRSSGHITFGVTSDLQETKSRITENFGNTETLGVMFGGQKEFEELNQKFATYKVDGEDSWFVGHTELFDYIDENATLDVSIVKPSEI